MKAVIAAGGNGTRLRPLTFTSNKHLIPIANRPLLFYALDNLAQVGIHEVGVIVNQTRPAIEAALGNGSRWHLKITYIDQPQPLGIGHVVKISEKFLAGEPFVYHLGDNIFTKGIAKPYQKFVSQKPDALLTIIKHKENFRLGVPYFDNQGKLVKVVEKPASPPNDYGIPGLYFFTKAVFRAFRGKDAVKPSPRGEYEVPDLYTYLIEHGYRVETAEIDGEWRDPGKFDDSLDANRLLLDLCCTRKLNSKISKSSKIEGKVEIGENCKIIASQITGPVSIGNGVSVQNSFIGPYTSIADGCEIRNSAVSNSILMERVDIIDIPGKIKESLIGKDATVTANRSAHGTVKLTISDLSMVEIPH